MGYIKAALPGATGAAGAPGAGGAPGVEVAAVTLGNAPDEQLVVAVGAAPLTVTGFWLMNIGPGGAITASDDDGLEFTVNCRSASNTIVMADTANTAADPDLHGIGNVDELALASYTFAIALTAPAGGTITIASATFGSGIALPRFVMGVYLG